MAGGRSADDAGGLLKRVDVSSASIVGLKRNWDGASLKDGATINLAPLACPSVGVDLSPHPSGGNLI